MTQTRIQPSAGTRLHPHRLNASALAVAVTLLGIWLFISPAQLDPHSVPGRELLNFLVVGGVLVVSGIVAAVRSSAATQLQKTHVHRRWGTVWLVVAAWLLISPWVLGFSSVTGLTVNAVVCAIILAGFGLAMVALTNRMGPDEHKGLVPPSGRLDVDA